MKTDLLSRLRRERFVKLATVFALIIVALTVILAVDNLLVSFVFAFVANYLLGPLVSGLERRGLSRSLAIIIPFGITGGLIVFGVYEVVPLLILQVTSLEAKLPKYQVEFMGLLSQFDDRFQGVGKIYNVNLNEMLSTWMMKQTAQLSAALPGALSASFTVALLAPLFSYFMLADGRSVTRKMLTFVPNPLFEMALNLTHQLNEQMGAFIRARFIEAAIVGLVVWVGLEIAGFPYATLLGLFAAITNLIPYLGPLIGAVPAVLMVLISPDAATTTSMSLNLVLISSIYLFAQLVDVIFVIPLLVAKIVNLHPVTVIIVIILGSKVMGILGMVISIPVASAMKLIFQAFYDHLMEFRT